MRTRLVHVLLLGRSWPWRLAAPNRETKLRVSSSKAATPSGSGATPLPPQRSDARVVGAPTRTPSGLQYIEVAEGSGASP